eukprot:TRINITY_DN594_c0_g3_i2.p1 TRINITY_DN594_c0_g3~~TRINITY_DN594_c0_g3_i2.p1  ORF type:complete len:469 (-),score=186.80 TRINITY_DN594_c0_g3_i2:201-1607(-)
MNFTQDLMLFLFLFFLHSMPRLREIVMTASKNIKTPQMSFPVVCSEEQAKRLARDLSKLAVADVLFHEESIVVNDKLVKVFNKWCRQYKIRLQFQDLKALTQTFGLRFKDLCRGVALSFVPLLLKAVLTTLKKLKGKNSLSADEIGVGHAKPKRKPKKIKREAIDEEESSDEEDDDEVEFSGLKHTTEDIDETDDEDTMTMTEAETDSEFARGAMTSDGETTDVGGIGIMGPRGANNEAKLTVGSVASKYPFFTDCVSNERDNYCEVTVSLPVGSPKLLMLSIAETVADKAVVRETKGLSQCHIHEDPKDKSKMVMTTEGVNFDETVTLYNQLDIQRFTTNDVHAMLERYGVEAARSTIIKEVNGVFSVYGIEVDKRHLALIGDYMTYDGGYRGMNRGGIDSCHSPFQQMSFETTMRFLTRSTLHGLPEKLETPSARLVMGRVVGTGTGAFDVLQDGGDDLIDEEITI